MKTVKLPAQGTVFDYYLDPQTRRFLPWSDTVPLFEMESYTPLQVRIYKVQIWESRTLHVNPETQSFQSGLANNHIHNHKKQLS